jgi:hypothetical protein
MEQNKPLSGLRVWSGKLRAAPACAKMLATGARRVQGGAGKRRLFRGSGRPSAAGHRGENPCSNMLMAERLCSLDTKAVGLEILYCLLETARLCTNNGIGAGQGGVDYAP